MFLDTLDSEAVRALLATTGALRALSPGVVELRHLGGALGRLPIRPNCVGGRDAAFMLHVVGHPPADATERAQREGREVREALAPWSSDVAPVDFLRDDPTLSHERCPWSQSDRPRLQRLKRELDPANTFRVGPTVPP
jgi:hypothetical protein